ncbi:hypothetical protein NL341_28660, partial [Klebsiella pneumoniae]|nr:hypothetical protein [Klebsiella pneumoniae]
YSVFTLDIFVLFINPLFAVNADIVIPASNNKIIMFSMLLMVRLFKIRLNILFFIQPDHL